MDKSSINNTNDHIIAICRPTYEQIKNKINSLNSVYGFKLDIKLDVKVTNMPEQPVAIIKFILSGFTDISCNVEYSVSLNPYDLDSFDNKLNVLCSYVSLSIKEQDLFMEESEQVIQFKNYEQSK